MKRPETFSCVPASVDDARKVIEANPIEFYKLIGSMNIVKMNPRFADDLISGAIEYILRYSLEKYDPSLNVRLTTFIMSCAQTHIYKLLESFTKDDRNDYVEMERRELNKIPRKDDMLFDKEAIQEIRQMLDEEKDQRAKDVIMAVYYEQIPYRMIADRLDISISLVGQIHAKWIEEKRAILC